MEDTLKKRRSGYDSSQSYNHMVSSILYGKETLKMEKVKLTWLSNNVRL